MFRLVHVVKGVLSLLTDLVLKKRSLFLAKCIASLHSQYVFFQQQTSLVSLLGYIVLGLISTCIQGAIFQLQLCHDKYILSLSYEACLPCSLTGTTPTPFFVRSDSPIITFISTILMDSNLSWYFWCYYFSCLPLFQEGTNAGFPALSWQ